MSDYIPLPSEHIPLSDMPDNKKWTMNICMGMFIENIPPLRRVYANYTLIAEYNIGDLESERIALVYLYLNGACGGHQQEFSRVFGIHRNTLGNYLAAYREHGIKGLKSGIYQPKEIRNSTIETTEEYEQIGMFKNESVIEDKSSELELSEKDDNLEVKNVIKSETVESQYGGYMVFYAFANEVYNGIIDMVDAVQKPILSNLKALHVVSLRNIFLSVLFAIFLGVYTMEENKRLDRRAFGAILGMKRSPCCKTIRTGLNLMTNNHFPSAFSEEMKKRYVKLGYVKLGIMYFDGHFIPYYGKNTVYKGYSTQRRLAMPGRYQNWASDVNGRPMFFYINNSFIKFQTALLSAVDDVLELMSYANDNQRLVVVFDREGYDGKLLSELDSRGIGFIMWKKNHADIDKDTINLTLQYTGKSGSKVKYKAHKSLKKVTNYRDDVETIVILDEGTNKQSTFINNLEHVGITDRDDSEKIRLLDGRWQIENYFKQAKINPSIDRMGGVEFEADEDFGEDANYIVANPEYYEAAEDLSRYKKKLKQCINKENKANEKFQALKRKKTLEEYQSQKSYQKIVLEKQELEQKIEMTTKKIEKLPDNISYRDLKGKDKAIFRTVKSEILLNIKASVFHMRKQLEDTAKLVFKDHRELSKFIASLTGTTATIEYTDKYCFVRLKKLDTPVYQASAEKLLSILNDKKPMLMDNSNRIIIYQFQQC